MKASLQLKIGQSLTMTPQLQQAIRLLQLSSIELQAEVQDALESNMMLEVDEGEAEASNNESVSSPGEEIKTEQGTSEKNTEMNQDNIPDELPVDSGWEDTFDSTPNYLKGNADGNSYDGFENLNSAEKTLREYLEWQLNLTPISDTDRVIAMTIIDSLDDDGYLSGTLEDILADIDDDLEEIGIEEIEAVLRMIQTMDPIGVGSRDIKECLSIQLKQCDPDTFRLHEAARPAGWTCVTKASSWS